MNDRVDTDAAFRHLLDGFTELTSDIKALDARIQERAKLNAIVAIYDQCKNDPDARIPTKLAVIIEAARSAA